jgi:hypothetical protein
MMHRRSFVGAALAAVVGSCMAQAAEVTVGTLTFTGGFLRASPGTAVPGAGFVTIINRGAADRLVSFASPLCARPELHTHLADNGMMMMRRVAAIDIPADSVVELKPGGLHLMLIGLFAPLKQGTAADITLIFEQAGPVTLHLPVKGPGAFN